MLLKIDILHLNILHVLHVLILHVLILLIAKYTTFTYTSCTYTTFTQHLQIHYHFAEKVKITENQNIILLTNERNVVLLV